MADQGFGVFTTDQPRTQPTPGAVPDPTMSDVVSSHWTVTRQDFAGAREQAIIDEYAALANHLDEVLPARKTWYGGREERYFYAGRSGIPVNANRIWADVAKRRADDPKFLADIPAHNDAEFRQWVSKREAQRRAAAGSVIERETGIGQASLGFATETIGGLADPINFGAMVLTGGASGAARSVINTLAREAAINAAVEVAELPAIIDNRAQFGEEMTVGDAVAEVATAGVAGAAFAGAERGVRWAARKAVDTGLVPGMRPDQRAARALSSSELPSVTDEEVLRHFDATVPEQLQTDTQRAAANVLRRQVEIDRSNPFGSAPPDQASHADRIDYALDALAIRQRADQPATSSAPPSTGFSGVNGIVSRIIQNESGGDPTARNPRGSASGLGQFTDRTWLAMAAQNPDLIPAGASRDEILALKLDPTIGRGMTERAVRGYINVLRSNGAPITDGNAYMMHFLGPDTALKVIRADPDTPVSALVSARAVRDNPEWLSGKSAGDLVADMDRRMGGDGTSGMGAPTLDKAQYADDIEWANTQAIADSEDIRTASPDETSALRRGLDDEIDAEARLRHDAEIDARARADRADVEALARRAAASAFDSDIGSPAGQAARSQVDSIQHDLEMMHAEIAQSKTSKAGDGPAAQAIASTAEPGYRLELDAPEVTFSAALAETDADLNAIDVARRCLAPGATV